MDWWTATELTVKNYTIPQQFCNIFSGLILFLYDKCVLLIALVVVVFER